MKKPFKRIMAMILVAVMLVGIAPVSGLIDLKADAVEDKEYERALFHLDTLNISSTNTTLDPVVENPRRGTYSAHRLGYAMDFIGGSVDIKAPFTGKIYISKKSDYNNDDVHGVYLQSIDKVYLANGELSYVTAFFCHDDDISNLYDGQIVKQGQVFYQQGKTGGGSTGVHSHIEVSRNVINNYSDLRSSKNKLQIYDALYLLPTTTIIDSRNLNWRTTTDYISFTLKNASEITDNSARLWCDFSSAITYKSMYAAYSTDESDIKVDFSKAENRTNSGNRKWYCLWSPEPPRNASYAYSTLSTFEPGTKYYYKMIFLDTNGKYHQSNIGSFTTTITTPSVTTLTLDSSCKDIGLGDVAKLTWKESKGAKSYNLYLYNEKNELVSEAKDVVGTVYAFSADCFAKPGIYKVKAEAVNNSGVTTMTGEPQIQVHDDVKVSFYDTVAQQNIVTYNVQWGHDCPEPQYPEQTGYNFKGWDKSFTKVQSNLTVNTKYEKKTYKVNFVDGITGETIASENVKYQEAAKNIPSKTKMESAHLGYTYLGWDCDDYLSVTDNTTVKAVYQWYDKDYPAITNVTSFVRNSKGNNNGYNFTVTVKNAPESDNGKVIKGRIVVALKNENGYLYTSTDSYAFTLAVGETQTISGFVSSDNYAYSYDVFCIENYENASPLAEPVSGLVDNSNGWSEWIEYSGEVPASVGSNGVIDVETKTDKVTYYQYADTVYGDELESTEGLEKVKDSNGNLIYKLVPVEENKEVKYASFPDSFDKDNSLYKAYNGKKVTAVDNENEKVVINSDNTTSYIYWHYCTGANTRQKPDSIYISDHIETCSHDGKNLTYNKFHAFESTDTYKTEGAAGLYRADDYWNASFCNTTPYYWYTRVSVNTQNYSRYKKVYQYYVYNPAKTTETPAQKGVTIGYKAITESVNFYRVKSSNFTGYASNANGYDIGNIYGYVDSSLYGGKEATVYIYKFTQPSDFTNEYVCTTEIADDGSVVINDVILREKPTAGSGDFSVAVSVKGSTQMVAVKLDKQSAEKLSAPKAEYTVKFLDYNNDISKPILEVKVKDGETVTAPDPSLLNIPDGLEFNYWSLSTVSVHDNLVVYPVTRAKSCVVVFIDWNAQNYEMHEVKYGDKIRIPELENQKFYESYWLIDKENIVSENGNDYVIAKGNEVFTSNRREESIKTIYIKPDFITALEEKYPEVDINAIGEAFVEFIEEFGSNENDSLAYDILTNEEKLELLAELLTEDFEAYLAELIYQEYASLTDAEKKEIIDAINEMFADSGYMITEKSGEGPVEVPADDMPNYIFSGWKSVKTGEYLTDTNLSEDDVFLPVYEFANTCSMPEASIKTCQSLDNSIKVKLTCDTDKAVIYYTISNDMASFNDPRVEGVGIEYTDGEEIEITKSSVLTFYATALGYKDSGLMTELYAMNGAGKGKKYYIVNVFNNFATAGTDEAVYHQYLVKEGVLLDVADITEIEGYTFDGLYYDADLEEEFDYTCEFVDDSLESDEAGIYNLYAKYIPDTFNVKFYDYDGKLLSNQTVDYGMSAVAPEVSRSGYVFTGWNSDEYTCVTKDGEYTAQYVSEDEYAVPSFSRVGSAKAGGVLSMAKKLKISYHGKSMSFEEYLNFGTVSWFTDNSDIATVDYMGNISFLKSGKVKIYVKIESSGEMCEKEIQVSADDSNEVTLSINSSLKLDSEGYIREVKAGTMASEVYDQFLSDEIVIVGLDGNKLADDALIGTGCKAVLYDEDGSELDSKIFVVTGDFDGNGIINTMDASHVGRYTVDKETAERYQFLAVDCNGDGRVNTRDASMILRYCVGKETF